MKKRILAAALSFCLLVGLLPTATLAAEAPAPTRTTTLDVTAMVTEDKTADEGWAWDAATKTLTLNGLNLSVTEGHGIVVPDGVTIVLAAGSNNTIKNTTSDKNAIASQGSLTVKSADAEHPGTLDLDVAYRAVEWLCVEDVGADITFTFSDLILKIKCERGIMLLDGLSSRTNAQNYTLSMTNTDYTFEGSNTARSLQVWTYKGDSIVNIKDSTIHGDGRFVINSTENAVMTVDNSTIELVNGGNVLVGNNNSRIAELKIIKASTIHVDGKLGASSTENASMTVDSSTIYTDGTLGLSCNENAVMTVNNSTLETNGKLLVGNNKARVAEVKIMDSTMHHAGGNIALGVLNDAVMTVDNSTFEMTGDGNLLVGNNRANTAELNIQNGSRVTITGGGVPIIGGTAGSERATVNIKDSTVSITQATENNACMYVGNDKSHVAELNITNSTVEANLTYTGEGNKAAIQINAENDINSTAAMRVSNSTVTAKNSMPSDFNRGIAVNGKTSVLEITDRSIVTAEGRTGVALGNGQDVGNSYQDGELARLVISGNSVLNAKGTATTAQGDGRGSGINLNPVSGNVELKISDSTVNAESAHANGINAVTNGTDSTATITAQNSKLDAKTEASDGTHTAIYATSGITITEKKENGTQVDYAVGTTLTNTAEGVVTLPVGTQVTTTAADGSKTEETIGDEDGSLVTEVVHILVADPADPAVAPTCTEAGKEAGKHCENCDYTEGGAEIPATGHRLVDDAAVAPTCTENGWKDYYKCVGCDKIFDAQTDGNEIADLDAWKTTEGQGKIPALGHTWGEGVVTTAPTYDAAGVKTYTCEVCGQTKTESIPAKQHTFSDAWSKDENNHWHTCTEDGCAEVKDQAAHTWNAGEVTTEPTYDAAGVKTYTCEVCGQTKTEEIAQLTRPFIPSSYAISISASENGTVSASRQAAPEGRIITLTAAPAEGYKLASITVTSATGKELTLTDKGGGKYTFVMPGSKVTVSATFTSDGTGTGTEQPLPFVDVDKDAYYYEAVKWAVENGITDGTSTTTFSPNGTCTRAQIVTFLWRAAGCPEPVGNASKFTDVEPGSFYEKAVAWAIEQGITLGTSDTTFSPHDTCVRAQIATFLWRYSGKPAATGDTFGDVDADAYYAEAVAWAVENAITIGTSETTFSPYAPSLRAQAVTMIYRSAAE